MKPEKELAPTAAWKADEVCRLIAEYRADEVLFIDDDEKNLAAVEERGRGVVCCASLEAALSI
jgi:hypothetical protein